MTLTNPVADTNATNVLNPPQRVIPVDLAGNASAASPVNAANNGVAYTGIQEIALGADNGTTIDKLLADGGVLRVSLQAEKTPVTSSATAAANTALATALLPAVTGKTNYVTGFAVTTQGGSGAAAGLVTITGPLGGTLNYQVGAPATYPVLLIVTFPSPIPASAVNTAITVNVPQLGANTGVVAAAIYGFVQ